MADRPDNTLEVIPPQKPKRKQKHTIVMRAHSGPLPSPEAFEAYERIQPGAADRIIKMAEDALKAEIRMGYIDRTTQFVSMFLGKFFIYALGGASVFLLTKGYEAAALLTGIAPIAVAYVNSVELIREQQEKPKKRRKAKRVGSEQEEVPAPN